MSLGPDEKSDGREVGESYTALVQDIVKLKKVTPRTLIAVVVCGAVSDVP